MSTLTHDEAEAIDAALNNDDDAPTHYALSLDDIVSLATYFDWPNRLAEHNWSHCRTTPAFDTIAEMAAHDAHRGEFLADISEFYGDDYYTDRRTT